MANYLIQFKYNGRDEQVPFESGYIFQPNSNPQILADEACEVAETYIHEKHLEIEGQVVYDLRLFGKNGDFLINVDEFRKQMKNG